MLETLERLILDPATEQPPFQVAANRPLEVTGRRAPSPVGHGIFLVDHQYPRPEVQSTYAGSRDTEGERRFGKPRLLNRKIPIKVFISEAQGVGAVTNLAPNPAGELAAKFTAGAGVAADWAVTRELPGINGVPSLSGEYRDKHAFDGAGAAAGLGFFAFTFPAPGTYVISLWVWIPSSYDGGSHYLSHAGDYAGISITKLVESDLTRRDEWQRIATKYVVAADTAGFIYLNRNNPQPSSVATGVFYSDALQIESGSEPSAFLCGDTPGCNWNGAPNASTSTRVGSGSDRKRAMQCLYDLQEKIEKLGEEGGTLKRYLPDGSWMVFDIEEASGTANWEKQFNQGQSEFSFELTCQPGARLAPVTFSAHSETTLPVLTFSEVDVPGNMAALGDLEVKDLQGVSRNFVGVYVASRFLDQSVNGSDFYEAEGRMRLSGAVLAEGGANASGAGPNNLVRCTLFEEYTPYISTRSAAGAYTSHVGAHKVFARVRPTTGDFISWVRFEYAQGDLMRWRVNREVEVKGLEAGQYVLLDLGVIRLGRAAVGTQRWEGRLSAKGMVAGKFLEVDWVAVMPVEECWAEARNLAALPLSPGSQVARDNFSSGTGGGGLAGKTATVGGPWSSPGGDADDFQVPVGGGSIYRQPASFDISGVNNGPQFFGYPSVTGRYARLGVGVQGPINLSVDTTSPQAIPELQQRGLIARYNSMSAMVLGYLERAASNFNTNYNLFVYKKVGNVWTPIGGSWYGFPLASGALYTMSLTILADGSGEIAIKSGATTLCSFSFGPVADLATGGPLASGGYGIYHAVADATGLGGTPSAAYFDNFTVRAASESPQDAVVYPNRSLRHRWDACVREAADGSANSNVGLFDGDRLLVPPSARESRPVRISVLASRVQPGEPLPISDKADDIRATLSVTPRVIEVPEQG